MNFDEIGLSPEIVKAISELGFEQATPIQEQTIPVLLTSDQDMIALAQTGTGKTAAFALPITELADPNLKAVQALILSPTRELAIQITKDIENFTKYREKLNVTPVYGGTSISKQVTALRRGAQIVVGTPGRVLDLIRQKKLDVSGIKWMVLDEADEMLNMGFQEDLDSILSQTAEEKQTLLFSATMSKEVNRIAMRYMNSPKEIAVGGRNKGASDVEHEYYIAHGRDRFEALKRLVDVRPEIYGIIFCRTRMGTQEVARKLMDSGYNADALHGDLSQAQRDEVMHRFRKGYLQLLVATDVAARGLDVNNLTHVINFDLPDDLEAYIHRSGRTGRAGKKGVSMSIIGMRERYSIERLQKMVGKPFTQQKIPTGEEVCEKQLFSMVQKLKTSEVDDSINAFLPEVLTELEDLSRDDLIKYIVSLEYNRFSSYYKNAPDLNERVGKGKERGDRGSRGRTNYKTLRLNLGKKHHLNVQKLMGVLNEHVTGDRVGFGRIDVQSGSSLFEVEESRVNDVIDAVKGENHGSTPMVVVEAEGEVVRGKSKPSGGRDGGRSRGPRGGDRSRSRDGGNRFRTKSGGRTRDGGGDRSRNHDGGDRSRSRDGGGNRNGGNKNGGFKRGTKKPSSAETFSGTGRRRKKA